MFYEKLYVWFDRSLFFDFICMVWFTYLFIIKINVLIVSNDQVRGMCTEFYSYFYFVYTPASITNE